MPRHFDHGEDPGPNSHPLNMAQIVKICQDRSLRNTYGGFHKWGYPNSWRLYKGKSHRSKWMMTGGTPMTMETIGQPLIWTHMISYDGVQNSARIPKQLAPFQTPLAPWQLAPVHIDESLGFPDVTPRWPCRWNSRSSEWNEIVERHRGSGKQTNPL